MAAADDLPWPELGNVSRGATRGNQGQKGVLGPADREGRCILQLRVQPGVLAVRLNRQASDWYRTLDSEVNRALKLTKTYWRKARRRQDYDARADQDHMELHEWLQQLKDKTMSHLELLMQKGDIQGPPYAMPDDIELTFLRKFIERQAANIPHNPRLRNSNGEHAYPMRQHSVESLSPEPSERAFIEQKSRNPMADHIPDVSNPHIPPHPTRNSVSPSMRNTESLSQEAATSTPSRYSPFGDSDEEIEQALQNARAAFARAQKDTQDALLRYTACLETENQARDAVTAAENRRDEVVASLLNRQPPVDSQSRHSSVSGDEPSSRYEDFRTADPMRSGLPTPKVMDWSNVDGQGLYGTEPAPHLEDQSKSRKHQRTWEHSHLQGGYCDIDTPGAPLNHSADAQYGNAQYACQDISGLPPHRKRVHLMPGYDVLGNTALQSNMTLQS
ncbi:putative NAD-aldehyde dehydrogenase [Mycena sanguinolenta]|uniref:Putative NAD-aldehyde dehydrogenase n=1 Tax=Mycena sanguinolenta TaxID=230812 RepID=A0A8H6YT07_9AGAR|nr:putative NAD-aldehyde dehydrogenase [Mycena sanguinolenta]